MVLPNVFMCLPGPFKGCGITLCENFQLGYDYYWDVIIDICPFVDWLRVWDVCGFWGAAFESMPLPIPSPVNIFGPCFGGLLSSCTFL
jgi:hypothetical protein